MGYRDDIGALRARVDQLAGEVSQLETRRTELSRTVEGLRDEVRRQRPRIALLRVRRWIVRHPRTSALLLTAIVATGAVCVRRLREQWRHRERVAQILGRGCSPVLDVDSEPGAHVIVNGLELGITPYTRSICPGGYRLRLSHRGSYPWQRVVRVASGRERIKVRARLIPWRPAARPAGSMVVFSSPPGAMLFLEGKEAGRTPVLLRREQLGSKRRIRVGLAADGYLARSWSLPREGDLWLHLPVIAERPR